MVTPIYTAPLRASYTSTSGGASGVNKNNSAVSSDDNRGEKDLSKGGSLAALDDQTQKGVISIQSIVTDFQNTMEALGVTPEVRGAVAPYLQVVAHQSQRETPAPGLMKQNLKAAADTMDQYITEALGQNSRVVREWVDALLLQPIEYKSDGPIAVVSGAVAQGQAQVKAPSTPVDMAALKGQLTQAQDALDNKAPQTAIDILEPALASLQNADAPKAKGRVLFLLGQASVQTGDTEKAKGYYQQALGVLGQDAAPIKLKTHYALGQIAQKAGQWAEAESHYSQVQQLAQAQQNVPWQGQALNQLGDVAMKQGKFPHAAQHWLNAVDLVEGSDSKLEASLYTQLGQVARQMGQPKDALGFYRQSLGISERKADTAGKTATLQKIASLYLDAGKVDKAKQILNQIGA